MARIQRENFDIGAETRTMVERDRRVGGVVTFLGTAREISKGEHIAKLEFEHYAGMAESQLDKLETDARTKFDIIDCLVIHRIGEISINENIVLIVVTSQHRAAAFDACEWMIDELKKRAPIWKKEFTTSGSYWVEEHP